MKQKLSKIAQDSITTQSMTTNQPLIAVSCVYS
jgi:hypothetical protein